MAKFTVLGYFEESNQTTADDAEAEDGMEAMRIVAKERLGERDAAGYYENQGEFQLICAVRYGAVEEEDKYPGNRFTYAGDGMVEARDFIEPGWELEEGDSDASL